MAESLNNEKGGNNLEMLTPPVSVQSTKNLDVSKIVMEAVDIVRNTLVSQFAHLEGIEGIMSTSYDAVQSFVERFPVHNGQKDSLHARAIALEMTVAAPRMPEELQQAFSTSNSYLEAFLQNILSTETEEDIQAAIKKYPFFVEAQKVTEFDELISKLEEGKYTGLESSETVSEKDWAIIKGRYEYAMVMNQFNMLMTELNEISRGLIKGKEIEEFESEKERFLAKQLKKADLHAIVDEIELVCGTNMAILNGRNRYGSFAEHLLGCELTEEEAAFFEEAAFSEFGQEERKMSIEARRAEYAETNAVKDIKELFVMNTKSYIKDLENPSEELIASFGDEEISFAPTLHSLPVVHYFLSYMEEGIETGDIYHPDIVDLDEIEQERGQMLVSESTGDESGLDHPQVVEAKQYIHNLKYIATKQVVENAYEGPVFFIPYEILCWPEGMENVIVRFEKGLPVGYKGGPPRVAIKATLLQWLKNYKETGMLFEGESSFSCEAQYGKKQSDQFVDFLVHFENMIEEGSEEVGRDEFINFLIERLERTQEFGLNDIDVKKLTKLSPAENTRIDNYLLTKIGADKEGIEDATKDDPDLLYYLENRDVNINSGMLLHEGLVFSLDGLIGNLGAIRPMGQRVNLFGNDVMYIRVLKGKDNQAANEEEKDEEEKSDDDFELIRCCTGRALQRLVKFIVEDKSFSLECDFTEIAADNIGIFWLVLYRKFASKKDKVLPNGEVFNTSEYLLTRMKRMAERLAESSPEESLNEFIARIKTEYCPGFDMIGPEFNYPGILEWFSTKSEILMKKFQTALGGGESLPKEVKEYVKEAHDEGDKFFVSAADLDIPTPMHMYEEMKRKRPVSQRKPSLVPTS